jgi:hypothetical protein
MCLRHMGKSLGSNTSVYLLHRFDLLFHLILTRPLMLDDVDGETRNPGFELLCTVKADLRKPFNAAPLRTGNGRDRYKEVQVRHYTT